VIPRPRIRLPLWAAVLILGAAYVLRALVLRHGDFSLDLPGDAIAFVTLTVGIAFVAWARHGEAHENSKEDNARTD